MTLYWYFSAALKDPGVIGKQSDHDFDCNIDFSELERIKEDPINFQNGLFKPIRMSQNSMYTSN
jgi:hypothetical protein